ncbi:MAG: hypothetical protein V1810_02495 [Candidatus Beckwithbacteria bacterium]
MGNSLSQTKEAGNWPFQERQLLTGLTTEQQFWEDLNLPSLEDFAPFVDQLNIYATDPMQIVRDFSPVLWNRDSRRPEWNKQGLKRLGLVVLTGTVIVGIAAACDWLDKNDDGGGATPTGGDKDNCSWLAAATLGAVNQLNEAPSYIGVDSASLANLSQLQADVQCFVPDAQVQGVFSSGENSLISIVAPNEGASNLRAVWGIVTAGEVLDDGQHEGKLVQLINASYLDSLSISRDDNGQLQASLDSAAVAEDNKVADGDIPSAKLLVQEDGNGSITGYSLLVGDQNFILTSEELGDLAGGGFLLGSFNEFISKEAAYRTALNHPGVSPDLTVAVGVSGDVNIGEIKSQLEASQPLLEAIKGQGFVAVQAGNLLNEKRDGVCVIGVTEKIGDPSSPLVEYVLVQGDGSLSEVPPGQAPGVVYENGIYFVQYGEKPEGGVLTAVQKEIVAMPDVFPGLECAGIIVSNPDLIPAELKQLGFDFIPGTKFFAIINPGDGKILTLVPSIYKTGDVVNVSVVGDGQLKLSVGTNGEQITYDLQVRSDQLVTPLPADFLALFEGTEFSIDGNSLVYTSTGGEKIQAPGEFTADRFKATLHSGRVIEIPQENLGTMFQVDSEHDLIKIFDENGVISAEYDYYQNEWIDIQNLANNLLCQSPDCFNEGVRGFPNGTVLVDFKSTGIFRTVDAIDNQTNNVMGEFLVVQFVTQDEVGKTITGWMLLQAEDFSNPSVCFYCGGAMMQNVPLDQIVDKTKLYSIDQWGDWMPVGSNWAYGFSKTWSNTPNVTLSRTQLVSSDNTGKVQQFLNYHGVDSSDDVILVCNSRSDRK